MSGNNVLAGSAGEHFVGALRRLDAEVEIAVVERALAGGECRTTPACRRRRSCARRRSPPPALQAAEAVDGRLDVERVRWWRAGHGRPRRRLPRRLARRAERDLARRRVLRPGVVRVERDLEYTVSSSRRAPLPRCLRSTAWRASPSGRAGTPCGPMPSRWDFVVLGEARSASSSAQLFARMGSVVRVVETNERVLEAAGVPARLQDEGIDIRVETTVLSASANASGVRLEFASGDALEAERVLVATGRRPNVDGSGWRRSTSRSRGGGITVIAFAPAPAWAIGDDGVGLLTHLGKYQARVAAANIAGHDRLADYRAIPAAVFTDPQVASVGTTRGTGVVTASYVIDGRSRRTSDRGAREGRQARGRSAARCPRRGGRGRPGSGRVAGAAHARRQGGGADRRLLDTIQPYPTFSEAIFGALLEPESALAV